MLTPPTYIQLGEFRGEEYAEAEQNDATRLLQQATDAVWATTGLEAYPVDPRANRITQNAILQFALWLASQDEHRDEINAPYSSERIGSYSYSKMQQAMNGEKTGIFWLDLLFKSLGFWGTEEDSWSSSENVMNPGGASFAQMEYWERMERADNFFYWGTGT